MVASRPNSLRSAHGRKDKLSKNTTCSILVNIIIRPFGMSLGYHFRRIALFKIKWRSNALVLCAMTNILVDQWRGSHK
jgi:hypothetical protein